MIQFCAPVTGFYPEAEMTQSKGWKTVLRELYIAKNEVCVTVEFTENSKEQQIHVLSVCDAVNTYSA